MTAAKDLICPFERLITRALAATGLAQVQIPPTEKTCKNSEESAVATGQLKLRKFAGGKGAVVRCKVR